MTRPLIALAVVALMAVSFPGCAAHKAKVAPDTLSSKENVDAAEKLIDAGDYQAAYMHLNAALAREPKNPNFHEQLGWAYLENGELDKASDELKALTELAPEEPGTYYLTGALYNSLEQPREALKNYELALKGDPENTRILFDIAETHHNLNQNEEALSYYQKGLELIPAEDKDRQGWFLFAICSTQYALNKADEAVPTCEKALKTTQSQSAKDRIQDFMQTIKLAQDLEK